MMGIRKIYGHCQIPLSAGHRRGKIDVSQAGGVLTRPLRVHAHIIVHCAPALWRSQIGTADGFCLSPAQPPALVSERLASRSRALGACLCAPNGGRAKSFRPRTGALGETRQLMKRTMRCESETHQAVSKYFLKSSLFQGLNIYIGLHE